MLKMNLFKKGMLLIFMVLLCTSPVWATITVNSTQYYAQASVDTSFAGSDFSDDNKLTPPAYADAIISNEAGTAAAFGWAGETVGGLPQVKAASVATVFPDFEEARYAVSVGVSVEAIFQITSTTAWMLEINTTANSDNSGNGTAAMDASVIVSGGANYQYFLSVDGSQDSQSFAAGTYNVVLSAVSISGAVTLPQGSPEFATSEVNMITNFTPLAIPVPAAGLMTAFGVGIVGWLRRKRL